MIDDDVAVSSEPASVAASVVPEERGIDPEDTTVVPAALTALVTAAQALYLAMTANGCYPAVMAVGAVEDTVASVQRIIGHLQPYVGDYSSPGAGALRRAEDMMGKARTALSTGRHSLVLDEMRESVERVDMSGLPT